MPLKIFQARAIKNTLAIAAGKGGVGKSTVTILLAYALKRLGYRVGVLDADLYGPSVRHMFPIDQPPTKSGNQLFPAVSEGIKILSMGLFQRDTFVRAPLANQLMRHFLKDVVWGDLDWLLIDFPPGTGDIPITTAQQTSLSGAILVSTPQKRAACEVRQSGKFFRKMRVPLLGIVENMSYFGNESCTPFGQGAPRALSDEMNIPFFGQIPIDPALSEGGDNQTLAAVQLPIIEAMVHQIEEGLVEKRDPVKRLSLADSVRLRVEWTEGETVYFTADQLQRNCLCAKCREGSYVRKDVTLKNFERVGRYACRFDFSSGCSYGIYSFDLLQKLSRDAC